MNYKELLERPEWRNKRLEILERDNYTCQRCGSTPNQILPSRYAALSTIMNLGEDTITEMYSLDMKGINTNLVRINIALRDEVNGIVNFPITAKNKDKRDYSLSDTSQLGVIFHHTLAHFPGYSFNGSAIEKKTNSPIITNKLNDSITEILQESSKRMFSEISNITLDAEAIWVTNKDKVFEVQKSDSLHVHHKCYRKNIPIWDQEDSEYVTLCNICHAIVHNNQLIPYFNNDFIEQYMNPCRKCDGNRYLDCYKHIDQGICYACNGTGQDNTSFLADFFKNLKK